MFKFVSTKNINELFQRAILNNDIQRTKLILAEAMKDPRFNIDQINEEGLTALQYSCFAGNVEIVKILTAYGANWKIRDRDGYTLMHASAMSGNGAVMRYLLQLGLKPTLKTDDGFMPIDVTDEIAVVVILLRAMLDQGYLQEMQDYMMDHPKLKRNIFKELEKVKCREQEKAEILNEMPYTSHTLPRQNTLERQLEHVEKPKKTKSRDGLRRSTSTFSELSDSIQQLDKLEALGCIDLNNNECNSNEPFTSSRPDDNALHASESSDSTLKRESSFSSTSSNGGTAGILRMRYRGEPNEPDNAYRDTQQYLETRFPPVVGSCRPKSVTFEVDAERAESRRHSDYRSPTSCSYEQQRLSNASQCSSQRNVIPIDSLNEPLYENASSARMRAKITETEDPTKIYSQTFQKQTPPPLPPRAPTTKLSDGLRLNHVNYNSASATKRTYEEQYISDRQLGSETDSGIDVNETAGRMFALSVNDREREDERVSYPSDVYSKPIGLYYSEHLKRPLARQHTVNDNELRQHSVDDNQLPNSFAIAKTYDDQKYKSWNGRTFHEAQLSQYNAHHRDTDANENYYDTRYSDASEKPSRVKGRVTNTNVSIANYQTGSVRKIVEPVDFSLYDFDNQPEIML